MRVCVLQPRRAAPALDRVWELRLPCRPAAQEVLRHLQAAAVARHLNSAAAPSAADVARWRQRLMSLQAACQSANAQAVLLGVRVTTCDGADAAAAAALLAELEVPCAGTADLQQTV